MTKISIPMGKDLRILIPRMNQTTKTPNESDGDDAKIPIPTGGDGVPMGDGDRGGEVSIRGDDARIPMGPRGVGDDVPIHPVHAEVVVAAAAVDHHLEDPIHEAQGEEAAAEDGALPVLVVAAADLRAEVPIHQAQGVEAGDEDDLPVLVVAEDHRGDPSWSDPS